MTLIEQIERALLDADAFVLVRGKADQGESFINPLADSPLRCEIADALMALNTLAWAMKSLEDMPLSFDYAGANRYDTDNQSVLHVWNRHGQSFDVRFPRGASEGKR